MNTILLNVRVQSIYFQTLLNDLGIEYATSEKRITIDEAKDILIDRGVQYQEILKVKYEYIELDIPLNKLEEYIVY